ncbi:MAG: hypothetical protein A2Y25_03990 [Candidatus Melainabacteria bacterium GWF2_37_15]|nr:MAG: hypothetical protein A2Y25_03990 [Candidatus Melainabacteria bacterium GWF2_37_15]
MYIIKSEIEKKKTLELIENFKKAIEEVNNSDIEDLLKEAQINGYKIQIHDLEKQIEEYEELKKGNYKLPEELILEELLQTLIKIRISRGISQSELARLLNVPRQQVNRYEDREYQGVNIERIFQILKILGIKSSIKLKNAA